MNSPDLPTPVRPRTTRSVSSTGSLSPAAAGVLLEGAELYRLLVDRVRDYAIFALDTTGHVLSWNAGAQRFKGYDRQRDHRQALLHLLSRTTISPAGSRHTSSRKRSRVGGSRTKAGAFARTASRFWANVVITALFDHAGTHVGFAKVTRDLTERRAAEEALKVSEERFRLLVQGVKDYAIFMLDPSGIVVSWNEGAQRIKGYTRDRDHRASTSPPSIPPRRTRAGSRVRAARSRAQEGRFEEEGWRIRKDGTRFWANVVITAVRNEKGRAHRLRESHARSH